MEAYSEKPPPPQRRRFYKNKKYWFICAGLTAIIVVVVVLLIIFVFFPMIAQKIMNQSGLNVVKAGISFTPPETGAATKRQDYDMNSTFYMHMVTDLTHTGPFSASIKFHNPIDVFYNDTLLLGTITLPETHVSGGKGKIDTVTPFLIADTVLFAQFTKEMLSAESFKWRIKGKLDISALTRTATVELDKYINLKGMNGFPEVSIKSFNLPGDAVGGGIQVELGTTLVSPSPIGVELGTIVLQVSYDGVMLGQVASEKVNLVEGANELLLKGTLVPQTDQNNLNKMGVLFSNYIAGIKSNTTAIGLSCSPDGVHAVGWLSEGFTSVRLTVGLGLDKPLDILHKLDMGYLDMVFDAATPYAPRLSAPTIVADFSVPFGFTLNITAVSQQIKLATNETGEFAQFSVPFVPAVSDQRAGKLQFPLNGVTVQAIAGKESLFNDFTYALTASSSYTFQTLGNASTQTMTPIGNITLSGIKFNLPTTLNGLQFLNSTPTVVNSLDVTGGTSSGLLMAIGVTMDNPSDVSLTTGDVRFALLTAGEEVGAVALTDLRLARGSNSVNALSTFNPNVSPAGQTLLNTFVMGQTNEVSIVGYDESTPIQSLSKALSSIRLTTDLPGLTSQLIQGSSLVVLDDSPMTGIVHVKVTIANPFSASLAITSVVSAITFQGMPIGNINQDISGNPIVINGHSSAESSGLDMTMNVEPGAVALLLRTLAISAGMDTRALDALLTMGGLQVDGMSPVSPDAHLFDNFNISSYVMQAMSSLVVDIQIESGLTVGEYHTSLAFAQNSVSVRADSSVTKLIPIVGQVLVQQIVDGSVLGFETIILSAPTDTGFTVQIAGSVSNTGPMAAQISFPTGLTIAWEGRVLGSVNMETINTQPNVGASFNVKGTFTVTDQGAMGDFAAYMINNADFQWNVFTDNVAVNALGFTFTNINMNKFVTLDGANGFKDGVNITTFNLPSNDPDGGITLTASNTIINPSQIGFELSGVAFNIFFGDVLIGPLASTEAVVIPPKSTATLHLKGRMIEQTSEAGLAAVKTLFMNYLANKATPLTIAGDSGSGPNGRVGWLSAGFSALKIENVLLPGPGVLPPLISSINMANIEMDFTKDPYAPLTSSTEVNAQLNSPFGFPILVNQLSMDATAGLKGIGVANLVLKDVSATTSPTGMVKTQFSNVPFSVFRNSHMFFHAFVSSLTKEPVVSFGLRGSTNAKANTAVGPLELNNIFFNVETSLQGFHNFGGSSPIRELKILGATSKYVIISTTFELNNPSQITAHLGDVTLDVIMNEFGSSVGQIIVPGLKVAPGLNIVTGEMHMFGTDLRALGQLLSSYMTGASVPLTVKGSLTSTTIPSLKAALSSVALSATMNGIKEPLLRDIKSYLMVDFFDSYLTYNFIQIYNPLDTAFTIHHIEAKTYGFVSYLNKKTYIGGMNTPLDPPLTVGPKSTVFTPALKLALDFSADLPNKEDWLWAGFSLYGDYRSYDNVTFDVYQNATVTIGDGFHAIMYYYQTGIHVSIETATELPTLLAANASAIASSTNATTSTVVSASVPSSVSNSTTTTTSTTPAATEATPTTTENPTSSATPEDSNPPPTTSTESPVPPETEPVPTAAPTTTTAGEAAPTTEAPPNAKRWLSRFWES
ncbi:hypothetical protein BX666DRAFT_2129623 [Dichotomocladium elegans]|nr:hypothetical protein BX666DRAFT_2129623 [Dichotomocladium elegans]